MLKNYIKTALRNLRSNKIFSIINVSGLAIGLACCLLIAVFVFDELSYDKYSANAKQLYRVNLGVLGNGSEEVYPDVDVAVGEGIKKAFPEVVAFTRVFNRRESYVQYKDKQFKELGLTLADENFLQMFSIPLIEGDDKTALRDPNTIVITKEIATKYFGNEDPVGKLLTLNTGQALKVTGVIQEVPANTHFHYDILMSMSSMPAQQHPTWSNVGYYTYVQLKEGTDVKKLEAKFPQLVMEHVVPEIQADMGVSLAEAQKSVNTFKFTLMPVTDIHLHSNTKYEIEANGDINYVYIFGALAIFILLLACVNFTNLSTASSARRAREVGIRKVMGSDKRQLVIQFLAESVLLTLCAMVLALVLVWLLLPFFNTVANKHISYSFFMQLPVLGIMLLVCLFAGIVAGIYPAFFISSFQPIKVLKGSSSQGSGRKSALRSSLVVFQFFVSTALIISTIIVYRQLHFMQDKKLGYDKEQILVLPDARLLGNNQDAFEQKLLQDNHVVSASISRGAPGTGVMNGTEIYGRNLNGQNSKEIHGNIYNVDYDYIPTLGMKMVQGRNFSKEYRTDSFAVVINEAAVRDLGWTNTSAIGKTIVRSGQREFKVIGVVQDFHYESVKQKIAPLMLLFGNNYGGLIVKVKTADVQSFIAKIKQQWTAFNPAGPFAYYFLDEKFAQVYAAEQRTGQIFTSFAVVAIVIASLGLFGLAAFITQQRTKEIGIRKVLGASVSQVLLLVTKEFVTLVGIACLIAIPVTWWAMYSWLQNFAYRVDIAWWVFAVAGCLALVIALLTISSQAVKAALANPVKALKE